MCMPSGNNPQINFYHFFHSLNLVILGSTTTEAYGHLVPCERNSSYNFIPILLKLYRCFCQGLKMCMTFGYNPQVIFLLLFSQFELSHFWAQLLEKLMDIRYLVSATPPTILSQSF